MKIKTLQDTIAAISTPKGIGAIAIVRVSGNKSIEIVSKIFDSKKCILTEPANRVIHGYIIKKENSEQRTIDEVLVTKFKAPYSYSGEDMVEISCHGGYFVVQEILNLILEQGARLAEPGEFTKRAFLNGKMDLLQAEAVADIINAQTEASLNLSARQLTGVLSKNLNALKERLKKECALLELELDFSEEDVEFADRGELLQDIDNLINEINVLLDSFKYGKVIREGIHAVIVGKPNVGKSSILNRLLQEDRAIVSEIPGTTRDSLEESLDIKGVLFKITDTAGLRDARDDIEKMGVQRTEKLIENTDMIIAVFDASSPLSEEDFFIIKRLETIANTDKKIVLPVLNKIDLVGKEEANRRHKETGFSKIIALSAVNGQGFDQLKREMVSSVFDDHFQWQASYINKLRHRDALRRAREHLLNARESMMNDLSEEFIALDLRGALNCIGELTGEVTSEDILNDIFASFCIGK